MSNEAETSQECHAANLEEQQSELEVLDSIFLDEEDAFSWKKAVFLDKATNSAAPVKVELYSGKISVQIEDELKTPLRIYKSCANGSKFGKFVFGIVKTRF